MCQTHSDEEIQNPQKETGNGEQNTKTKTEINQGGKANGGQVSQINAIKEGGTGSKERHGNLQSKTGQWGIILNLVRGNMFEVDTSLVLC